MCKFFLTTVIAALCLTVLGCAGGFEDDGAGADKLGPLIFADTASE